jgi:hypothetical protein
LLVDYSKALYEVYEDMIRHQYHWTKANPSMLKENKRTVVHFGQIVQKVLGGPAQMHQDFAIQRERSSFHRLLSKTLRSSNPSAAWYSQTRGSNMAVQQLERYLASPGGLKKLSTTFW